MIKYFRISLIAMALSVMPAIAGVKDLPVTVVDGRSYHYYIVEPKQTIYSICRELGITKSELIEANPELAEHGLKANQRLLFPTAESSPSIHLVSQGETIYGISTRYGITPSQLDEWNPGIRNGIRPGDRLVVSEPAAAQGARNLKEAVLNAEKTEKTEKEYVDYLVKDKETFYSIAQSHGLSVADLEAANPDVTLLRAGTTLRVPVAPKHAASEAGDQPAVAVITDTLPAPARMPQIQVHPLPAGGFDEPQAVELATDVNIAVVLPFMLGSGERDRKAERFTEFYKGFLIAVDSLRNGPRPIRIQTYDTEGSLAKVRDIMSNPELAEAQVIIAPDNAEQLEALSAYGAEHGIDVMNLFVVADQSYRDTPNLFQATIPHDAMYASAIDGMIRHFADGFTPVVLRPADGKGDKDAFVRQLTETLNAKGIDYITVEYNGLLTPNNLEELPRDGRYAFIPTSSRQGDLNRLLPALIELKGALTDVNPIRLYGYPEWTTFRGETLMNMHTLNTFVYSRFFTSPDDLWVKRVEEAFDRWYGEPMAAAVPRQGLLGFDTGMFLIGALSSGQKIADAPVYHGVQNAFRFIRPLGTAGYVNDDLYFVNFRPSGLTDRISL